MSVCVVVCVYVCVKAGGLNGTTGVPPDKQFFCVFIDNQSTRMLYLSRRSLVSKFWEAVVSYVFCRKYA